MTEQTLQILDHIADSGDTIDVIDLLQSLPVADLVASLEDRWMIANDVKLLVFGYLTGYAKRQQEEGEDWKRL